MTDKNHESSDWLQGLPPEEIEQVLETKPNLGTCMECHLYPAVTDYNGLQHYVCAICNGKLSSNFKEDEEE